MVPLELEPMLTTQRPDIPTGPGWVYEPKWDGHRILAHRHGHAVELVSRGARRLTRYFPELVAPLRGLPAAHLTLDGEVVLIGDDGALDFDGLQQRIHPAASRIEELSRATPVRYVAFDALQVGDDDLRARPLAERRARLQALLASAGAPLHLTPTTHDAGVARGWFTRLEGAGLDGLVAKRDDAPYQPGRRAWVKVKHARTADCVVIGYRLATDGGIASLLLGLYDGEGTLHYVGHTSALDAATRRALIDVLEPLRQDPPDDMGRRPDVAHRWSRGQVPGWASLQPALVCEVTYDKLQSGERFRHAAGLVRWRTDKPARECTFDQVASAGELDVAGILGIGG
jgi:ATP-dependent DNA ligase